MKGFVQLLLLRLSEAILPLHTWTDRPLRTGLSNKITSLPGPSCRGALSGSLGR